MQTRPLPPKVAVLYLREKYIHEQRLEIYITDCLWLQATGKVAKEMTRYSETLRQITSKKQDERTGNAILADTILAFEQKGG